MSIRSLLPEQMGAAEINTGSAPERAQAWVLWEDGIQELAQAHAILWTKRAGRVRFGAPRREHESRVCMSVTPDSQ